MSYSATLAQRNIVCSRDRKRVFTGQNQNRRAIVFLLILLIVLCSILYIVQANSVATGGYKIQKYKKETTSLQSENKSFELELSRARSLGFLEERVKSLNMVKISKVEYLSPISQVAAR